MSDVVVSGVRIEAVIGDIVAQPDVDAVVNAANAELMSGGGVAGAIHRAAGPGLAEECRPMAPIRPGECVLTSGHDLSNPHVLHCLGPVYGVDEPAAALLASCYHEALNLADNAGLTSVAFPAISSGAFGYPMQPAAETAVTAVADAAPDLSHIELVRFVLADRGALEAFQRALAELDG